MVLAKLRVCASCEWIFKLSETQDVGCPKCSFGSYGAHFVYGNKAYTYAKTQKPWFDKDLAKYETKLLQEIRGTDGKNSLQTGLHN